MSMLTDTLTSTPRYFAVRDPANPNAMTYWFRSPRGRNAGRLLPWPPRRAHFWRYVYAEHPQFTPGTAESKRDVADYFQRVRGWRAEVEAAIDRDPNGCAARFAALNSACGCCGKPLTEEHSRVYGIGPECRAGASPAFLASMIEMVRHAHGERVLDS